MFFKEEPLPIDARLVLEAAAILQVKEFKVFELAYAEWFGRRPETKEIEPLFVTYMFRTRIPVWVRQFTRKIRDINAEGRLNRAQYGLFPKKSTPQSRQKGYFYAVLMTYVTLFLVVMSTHASGALHFLNSCHIGDCL